MFRGIALWELVGSAVIWFTLLNDINSTLRYEYYRAWSCDRSPSLASRPATASRERQRLGAARDVTTYAHRSLSFVVILELFSTFPIATAKVTIVEK